MTITEHRRHQAELLTRVTMKRRVQQAQQRAARANGPCTCLRCQLAAGLKAAIEAQGEVEPAPVPASDARH